MPVLPQKPITGSCSGLAYVWEQPWFQGSPLAPKRYVTIEISGDWLTMIDINRVDGQDRFGKTYPQDADSPPVVESPLSNEVKADVKEAVDDLDASDLVFGDLRFLNLIAFRKSGTHPIMMAGCIPQV